MQQLFYDPVKKELHYRSRAGSWIRIEELNPYCLRHTALRMRQEKKEESIYWRLVADEVTRRGMSVPTAEEKKKQGREDPDFVKEV